MDKYRLTYAQLRASRQSQGLCRCGRGREDSEHKQCRECRAMDAAKRRVTQPLAVARRKANGVCITCACRPADEGFVTCATCRARAAKYKKDANARRERNHLCRSCGAARELNRKLCPRCLQYFRLHARSRKIQNAEAHRRRKQAAIDAVLRHYGDECACCGEVERVFLTVDHLEGTGAAHRKQIRRRNIYFWLVKNHFPQGFQILCFNCNCAKERVGQCPHRGQRFGALFKL